MSAKFPHLTGLMITLICLPLLAYGYEHPLFDAHLHYNPAHVDAVEPERVGSVLAGAGIGRAVILARDDTLIEAAMRAAPGVIVPFLDVYRPPANKDTWMHDPDLPERMRARLDAGLETGEWRGIGELHLFADDRHSPVFEALVVMARERGLPVMIHGDPAVVDRASPRTSPVRATTSGRSARQRRTNPAIGDGPAGRCRSDRCSTRRGRPVGARRTGRVAWRSANQRRSTRPA